MKKTMIAIMGIIATFTVDAAVYRAGLKGGYVNTYDTGKYHSQAIDAIGVFNGPVAGTNSSSSVSKTTYPPIWVNNRTWEIGRASCRERV